MKTKNILHLVAFVLTFAVSVSVAGVVKSFQGLSTGEKITNVLSQDINNGLSRRTNYKNSINYIAEKTDEYVSASEKLNVSGLPEDFQAAWQKHMQAWRIHADYLNERKYSREFNADYDAVSANQSNEINRTWYEVLRVARENGAKIPRNAYY
jgi:succinate dehydrogenase/fumarate reductase flavoprotein subunit